MSTFEWTLRRKKKGGIKMHTLRDLKTQIPTLFHKTPTKINYTNTMDFIPHEENLFFIFDKSCNDFKNLYNMKGVGGYFVVNGNKSSDCQLGNNSEYYYDKYNIEIFFKVNQAKSKNKIIIRDIRKYKPHSVLL